MLVSFISEACYLGLGQTLAFFQIFHEIFSFISARAGSLPANLSHNSTNRNLSTTPDLKKFPKGTAAMSALFANMERQLGKIEYTESIKAQGKKEVAKEKLVIQTFVSITRRGM